MTLEIGMILHGNSDIQIQTENAIIVLSGLFGILVYKVLERITRPKQPNHKRDKKAKVSE